MSAENVVPLNFDAECIRGNVSWMEDFVAKISNNEIAALSLLAIDKDGEPLRFQIVPVEGPTLRLMLKGMLHDALDEMTPDWDKADD